LQIADMQVREIMVPRGQMVVIEQSANLKEFLPAVIESGHSRFPVIGETRDEIIGILLAKDLLAFNVQSGQRFNIRDLLRPVVFVPESKRLNQLLQEFRVNHNHMAIVVDEYGGVSGLITIEDVLEQIVGDIEDEYDIDEESFIKQLSKSQYTVKALTPIEEFNQYFGTNIVEKGFDTVGGVVMHAFGHLPKRGEIVSVNGFRFKVLLSDKRQIRLLRVFLPKKV
jgi:magnesium and cobalt transporter